MSSLVRTDSRNQHEIGDDTTLAMNQVREMECKIINYGSREFEM